MEDNNSLTNSNKSLVSNIKDSIKKSLHISEQKSNDVLGAYPQQTHVKAFPERRYLKASRSLTVFSVIALSGLMVLASLAYMMAPSVDTSTILLTENKRITGIMKVEPLEVTAQAINLFYERIALDYVIMRHEVTSDPDYLANLWKESREGGVKSKLIALSSKTIAREISDEMGPTLKKVTHDGFTRRVVPIWIEPLSLRQRTALFIVRFETHDFFHGKPDNTIKNWEALIRIVRGPEIMRVETTDPEDHKMYLNKLEVNPLNLTVTTYVLSYAGSRNRIYR